MTAETTATTAEATRSAAPVLPPRPRLVLRLGFAGRKDLTDQEQAHLNTALDQVLQTVGNGLATTAPGVTAGTGNKPRVARFYATECPLLRLVTGLCEGSDSVAAQALERLRAVPDVGAGSPPDTICLKTELAAVLPFAPQTYRDSRPVAFHTEFDRQLARCAWVLALDGIYEKPQIDTPSAKNRRSRAYRAQSAVLLRQCDMLIAAANPDEAGKAGGTLETVRNALAFELPVVFIHTGTGTVHLMEPEDDLHSALATTPPDEAIRTATLQRWVTQLTADPDSSLAPEGEAAEKNRAQGDAFLAEFFEEATSPSAAADQWTVRLRKWVWACVENKFRPKGIKVISDPELVPYATYRHRAKELNYHYSGLYRGAFMLNYLMAILAVLFATISLTLIGSANPPAEDSLPLWVLVVLLALAAGKLGLLWAIHQNTHHANHEHWNEKAVGYRYLAERLRAMFYLPETGSAQPPAATPPQFASRVVRQSAVDWLFDALVRGLSPADLAAAKPDEIPASGGGSGTVRIAKLIRLHPQAMVEKVRDRWIEQQANYHERNSGTMDALHHFLERLGDRLGWTVITIVGFDILLILAKVLHWLPDDLVSEAKAATPWLIAVTAVLPAIIAALGGIRFQSECQRLAERSAVMRVLLRGHPESPDAPNQPKGRWGEADDLARRIKDATTSPATDPGSWSHDALRLSERVAFDFIQEAAEWSVLYAREVSHPG